MKKKILFLIISVLPALALNGQKLVTLRECYERSAGLNPISGEATALSEISGLRDQNLSKGWLPTIDLNGTFLYNSSVIDMGSTLGAIPVPGISDLIKPLPHEQYKVTIDISQVFYDGGAVKNARELEQAELAVNIKQTEADIYKIRSQVNTYFFNILLLDRQKAILKNYIELISKRITSIASAINNGVALKSDADILTAEKIKLEQQLSENNLRRQSFLSLLSGMTGIEMDESSVMVLPEFPEELPSELKRPEIELLDLRMKQLGAGIELIDSRRLPKAFGFATIGYGNPPGNNFFKDEFAPYYIVGAGIKWNILDWNKASNERQAITLQQGIIENRKSDLSENLTRMLQLKQTEIMSLTSLLETDRELIALRKNISSSAVSQYENGTISASEMLSEITAEKLALINLELHSVNLAMARTEYLNINGQEIK